MTKRITDNVLKGLLIAGAVAVALPVPDMAFAATGAGGTDLASTATYLVTTELTNVPNLISAAFYVGGTLLVGAGLLKLKQHSENPGQTPLGQALGRIAIGGALLALPFFTQWAVNSIGTGASQASYTQMTGTN